MEFETNFSPEKGKEKNKNNKEIKWKEIVDNLKKLEDKLGMKIDEGIKETVAAFKVHGFPTNQSCEGHIDKEHGTEYPWVEVYPPLDKNPSEMSSEEREELKNEKKKYRKEMTDLLAEFYQDRDTQFEYMLNFKNVGYGFRIQSTGAENSAVINSHKIEKRYEKMKKEMQDFTKFLKEKYFEEN